MAQKKDGMSLSPQEIKDIYAYYEANKNKDLDYTQKIPPHQLHADLKMLKLILEEAHTNIYNYSSKEQVTRMLDDAIFSCNNFFTYFDLLRKVSEIQNMIACGHSGWQHPTYFRRYRNTNIGLFPLDVNIINGRYHITNSYADVAIPEGSYITDINFIPVDSISRQLRKYMPRDGNSNMLNEQELSEMFRNAYSNFIGNPSKFNITYYDALSKTERDMTLLPVTRSKMDTISKEKGFKDKVMGMPLLFNIDTKNSMAIYKIKWFNNEYMSSQGQEFISFTDSIFH